MTPSALASPTIALLTLGCAKNEVDSRSMEQTLAAEGFTVIDDLQSCDVIVVNTCAFIEAAVEESIDAILEVLDSDRVKSGEQKVVVSGCLPSRYGEDLTVELPEVAAFVPCAGESSIARVIADLTGAPKPKDAHPPLGTVTDGPEGREHPSFAYVKISEGCNRRCSFCTIPDIRGPYRSFAPSAIIADVERARARGAREIDLIGQDTGLWGADLGGGERLADLVRALDARFDDLWFRLLYVQPDALSDDLLKAIAASPSFCRYLDIPIQHVDPTILKAMGRNGSAEEFTALCRHIREVVAGAVLRTTVIVGFPGETPEAFEALCDFVAEGIFDYVGIFPYSAEEGTPAAALPDPVDEEERLRRWQTLHDVADEVCPARLARFVGDSVEVLIDGIEEDGQRFGRTRFQAPEVDGVTFVDRGEVGERLAITLEDSFGYDFEGR